MTRPSSGASRLPLTPGRPRSGSHEKAGTLPWGAEIALRTPFFEELYLVDPLAFIDDYAGPLLVIVGTRDNVVFSKDGDDLVILQARFHYV